MQKLSLADYPEEILKLKYKGKIYEMRLGIITSAKIFNDMDHGILTCWINFDFQGFGGYQLDTYHKGWKKATGKLSHSGADWIKRANNVFGITNIEDAKGRIAFALYPENKSSDLICGIKAPHYESDEVFLISEWRERWGFAN